MGCCGSIMDTAKKYIDEQQNASKPPEPRTKPQKTSAVAPGNPSIAQSGAGPLKRRVVEPRQLLEPEAKFDEDFLTHHLKHQLSLSRYVNKQRIKRRQILEHITLQKDWGNIGGKDINILAYFETANSAWMQRTFLDIWEDAHNDFFNKDVEEKVVRRKVSEQYMFELY